MMMVTVTTHKVCTICLYSYVVKENGTCLCIRIKTRQENCCKSNWTTAEETTSAQQQATAFPPYQSPNPILNHFLVLNKGLAMSQKLHIELPTQVIHDFTALLWAKWLNRLVLD